jgi:hypothetical protein
MNTACFCQFGQVLFAIFTISIMFPCRFHKARELNTIFGTKSLSQFPFFRCRSFTYSLRHREIDKNMLCSLIILLLPSHYKGCISIRHLLREIITSSGTSNVYNLYMIYVHLIYLKRLPQ